MARCAAVQEGLGLLNKLPTSTITTPLQWRTWSKALQDHPDQRFCKYIVTGLRKGFRIGFQGNGRCCLAKANMRSAAERAEVVSECLQEECASGRVLGPFRKELLGAALMINRFGVIPKGSTGKWCLIVDLSFPEGNSVNDGINPNICSLHYARVEDAAKELVRQGRGSFTAKVDIRSAYQTVPGNPQDWWLLGMQWEDSLFVDTTLPFGLRSAPIHGTSRRGRMDHQAKRSLLLFTPLGRLLDDRTG